MKTVKRLIDVGHIKLLGLHRAGQTATEKKQIREGACVFAQL